MFVTSTLAFALAAGIAFAAPEEERVISLPGMGTFDDWGMFSGYITHDGTTKESHYVFVESQNDPANDPVLIWFNGGPGCSSMLGFIQENGPFKMHSGTEYLTQNRWSWNREASVLYIDNPAGVGYSYCNTVDDCTFDDHSSAEDNLNVVLAWYEKYPEYKTNDLFISGESYAGIYVPYLAKYIDQYIVDNASDSTVFVPNLKGFAVGNGVTNWEYDTTPAYIEMGYWHSLYAKDLHDEIQTEECDFGGIDLDDLSDICRALGLDIAHLTEDINIYNIFDVCWGVGDAPLLYATQDGAPKKAYSSRDYTPWAHKFAKNSKEQHPMLNELPPCTWGSGLLDYFNRIDVRQALHIPMHVQPWDLCTEDVIYNIEADGSQYIYEELYGKYKMLHYSGDIDGAVPTRGTKNWIKTMNWTETQQWKAWFYNEQIGGYLVEYEGLFTLATVHGAGHMVPEDKPEEAYHLIFNWMFDRPIIE